MAMRARQWWWPMACVCMAGAATPACAQGYPQKSVRIVVPFAPGGASDIIARLLAADLTEAFGQNVVVDNRGGGGTVLGTEIVARAPADGHTLLVNTPSFTINAGVRKLPYDSFADFSPVTLIAVSPLALVTHPSLPVRSMKELIALAKSRPGQLIYASSGQGSPTHMGMELLRFSGVRMTHVPYKGAAPALTDLIGGHVQLMQTSVIVVKPHAATGRLRPIAVTTAKRSAALPDVQAIAETIPGYEVLNWWGLTAPAKTPAAIVERLHSEVARSMAKSANRERLVSEGVEPARGGAAEFAAMLRGEADKWGRVGREIHLKLD
jgi:tripartite-type tricarboxylate transporter receptor subunit TctC